MAHGHRELGMPITQVEVLSSFGQYAVKINNVNNAVYYRYEGADGTNIDLTVTPLSDIDLPPVATLNDLVAKNASVYAIIDLPSGFWFEGEIGKNLRQPLNVVKA